MDYVFLGLGNWGFSYSYLVASVRSKQAHRWYGLPLLGVSFAIFIVVSITTIETAFYEHHN